MKPRIPIRLRALISILFGRPVAVKLPAGHKGNLFPDLSVLPVIAGGSGEGEGGGEGSGERSGSEEGEGSEEEGSGEGEGSGEEEEEGSGGEGEGEGGKSNEPNWKSESRKHERRAKKTKKELDELQAKLKEREDAQKSEHEKALEKARKEGEERALSKAEKERQADRLEVAVTRIAAKSLKVGEGDDAKEVKFADPEDAHTFLNRKLANGDLDTDDIFGDDGKVKSETITETLQEILAEKPHLAASEKSDGKNGKKPSGDGDGGKGNGSAASEATVEAQLKRVKRS